MTLSLASLNLHAGLDATGRPYAVADAIAGLGADVVVVQENWRPDGQRSLAEQAAARCGYAAYAEIDVIKGRTRTQLGVAADPADGETGAWGLAIMSRLPWRALATLPLGAAPGDVVGERRALLAEIPTDDGVLRVAGVHLTHRLVHGPAQLRRLLAGLARSPLPTVVAGDFNMCRPAIHLARPYRTTARGRTWPAARPVAQIDHILAGPGVTARDAAPAPAVGSDHLPVRATLTLTVKTAPVMSH